MHTPRRQIRLAAALQQQCCLCGHTHVCEVQQISNTGVVFCTHLPCGPAVIGRYRIWIWVCCLARRVVKPVLIKPMKWRSNTMFFKGQNRAIVIKKKELHIKNLKKSLQFPLDALSCVLGLDAHWTILMGLSGGKPAEAGRQHFGSQAVINESQIHCRYLDLPRFSGTVYSLLCCSN